MKKGVFFAAALCVCTQANAHFELYHRIEVRIVPEESWLELLIHQSDLEGKTIDAYLRANFAILVDGKALGREPIVDRRSADLPDGFLSAGFVLSGREKLGLHLLHDSGKRLLFVITRSGVFPVTRDLAPGDEIELVLR
ncbi:MAG: hypothetical protein AAGH89_12335 [Verrucomicrobiota bacterium]